MPNNPYQNECEVLCDKLSRFELAKQNFKVLQSDFAYNPSTNTYTGTYMNIEVAGEIFMVEEENIVISQNTNTVIVNFGVIDDKLVPSITTEQKPVSEVSTLMISETYTSSAGTCSFTLPIQLDGKATSGGETLCEQLKEDLITIPHFITRPGTFNYTNGRWDVNGLIAVEKGQNTFQKEIVNFVGFGNNLFIKVYANTNNFELEARQFNSPIEVEEFVKNNASDCIYYIPVGFGDGTTALQHYSSSYDVFLGQFKELVITRHYEQTLSYSGEVFRVGGNTQGAGVRAGFRNNNFFKPNHDNRAKIDSTSGGSFTRDQLNQAETDITLANTNFMDSFFKGSFSTASNSFHTFYTGVGVSNDGGQRETISGSMTIGNNEVAKSFFIKNVLAVPVNVRMDSITRGLIWIQTS